MICTTHVIFIKASRRLIYFFPQRRGKGGTDKKKIKKCKGEKDARKHEKQGSNRQSKTEN